MEKEKNQPGQELLDIDDQGNYNDNQKEKEQKKSNTCKYCSICICLIVLLGLGCFCYYKQKSNKTIYDKIKLKNLNLKSRIIFGPIFDDSFKDGKMSDKWIKKFETMAKNNVALIITEGMMVGDVALFPPTGRKILKIDSDEYIEEYKKLTDRVHKLGSYIIMQLNFPGLLSSADVVYSPSPDKAFFTNVTSKAVTKEDMLRIQDLFVQGAIRGKKAGFDGIDIHGSQLNFAGLFLSTKFNRRTDEYGGSVQNRLRFVIETLKKIREAIGDDMTLSIKIDCEEEASGFTEKDFLEIGKILQDEAGIDLIHVSGTNVLTKKGELLYFESTKKLADILKIPVICIGGIKTYENADYVLKNSNIEYIAMSRGLMKDPELVTKWTQQNQGKK
jgi:2,4-dienoyl-CoA reductase-like NADH-dependent reductase (Old Yellow Enzyme family)